MKIIYILITLFHLSIVLADNNEPLFIELGDSLKIPTINEKIWIENQKIVLAQNKNDRLILKALSIGTTKARFDQKNKTITVLPAGQIQSYNQWKKLSYQFADLRPGLCDKTICLLGKISTLKEFEKIIQLIEKHDAPIYLGNTISSELKDKIDSWYSAYAQKNGYLPFKVVYGKIWTTYTNNNETYLNYKYIFEKIGLYLIEDKSKISISENLRVEIKVIEVKKELVRRLGIKWPDTYSASILDVTKSGWNNFDIMLNASELSGDMNILASPNLMCKSGKEATFFAGGEFPIKTIGEKYSAVVWKQYGINLKIKPLVDSIGQISLEIESEVSSIDKSREVDGIPALHSHKVSSHFDLLKTQTIILSGLIKSENGSSSEGLPYLSQIPILGRLFSSKDFLENKTELLIFVTPKISN